MDLVPTKEAPESLKIKLPDETIFNMSFFSQGNTEEYLAHVVAVLRLINKKGLDVQCRKLAKAVDKLAGMLDNLQNLQKTVGTNDAIPKNQMESRKLEIEQTQEMLQKAQKVHNEAIAKTYEHMRNLLSSDVQSQCNCVCCKMHERDLWAGLNGQVTKGKRPHTWTAFQDCLELHKLTVFTADAAKRQRFYIQQAVHKPQRATVQQNILRMGVLND
jgi:hypothetical protein